jgi:ribosomal protein S18 acetylase RimI-like enzyme
MSAAFSIRKGNLSDFPIISAHRVGMFRDMGVLDPNRESELIQATSDYLQKAIPEGEYLAWLAESTDSRVVIGGAGVQLRRILPRADAGSPELERGPEAIVLNVYVEQNWRRKGVAEALMRRLLEEVQARGIRRVVLHASPEGRGLYERLGFAATNEMRLMKPQ